MTAPASLRYRLHETPIGDVLIVTTEEGIVTLHPLRSSLEAELEGLARRLGVVPQQSEREEDDAFADAAAEQLDDYFDGARQDFDLELDWRLVRGFTRAALEAVQEIPYAETAAYGEVAITAGTPRAARAVGTACASTPFSIVVPVHRVVRSDGSIGEYGGHPEDKRFLLDLERQVAGE